MLTYYRIPLFFAAILFSSISFSQTAGKIINPDARGITGETKTDTDIHKTIRYKPHRVTRLPSALNETSSLVFFNGQLFTINDGGNPPEIFQIDTASGKIVRKATVRNTINSDWESLAQDDRFLYIGDCGNNYGNRTDLCILKIEKSDLLNTARDTIIAGFIRFNYSDQAVFTSQVNNHNFDCEALIFYNDSLHLFSKNWADLQTKHYVLPADTGTYTARLAESFNADGLITDASINSIGNIILLGYKKTKGRNYRCFAWELWGYRGSHFFRADTKRIKLGSALRLGQTEGIVLKNNNTGWISSESISLGCIHRPAKLLGFSFGGLQE